VPGRGWARVCDPLLATGRDPKGGDDEVRGGEPALAGPDPELCAEVLGGAADVLFAAAALWRSPLS
jgi:hypothetical protein